MLVVAPPAAMQPLSLSERAIVVRPKHRLMLLPVSFQKTRFISENMHLLGAGDSGPEVYGRLYGTANQLPPWTGRSGAYTPFEYVEFGDTEILHDLEVMVRLHHIEPCLVGLIAHYDVCMQLIPQGAKC